jgi:hypothetical protein
MRFTVYHKHGMKLHTNSMIDASSWYINCEEVVGVYDNTTSRWMHHPDKVEAGWLEAMTKAGAFNANSW